MKKALLFLFGCTPIVALLAVLCPVVFFPILLISFFGDIICVLTDEDSDY